MAASWSTALRSAAAHLFRVGILRRCDQQLYGRWRRFGDALSGATAANTIIAPFGALTIGVGGAASSITVLRGGNLSVAGVVSGVTAYTSGAVNVGAFGSALGVVLSSGSLADGGFASGVTVDGGTAAVSGIISGAIVNAGGELDISSGGLAGGTVISGGRVSLDAGALINNGIDFATSGGELDVIGLTTPTGVLSAFQYGDVIYLTEIVATSAVVHGSVMTVATPNNAVMTFNMAGVAAGTYLVAPDGAGEAISMVKAARPRSAAGRLTLCRRALGTIATLSSAAGLSTLHPAGQRSARRFRAPPPRLC